MNCARAIMVLNIMVAVTSAGGAGVPELELPRARSWDLGKLAAGTAALTYPS